MTRERIGRYDILAEVRSGRLTAVFRGRHRISGSECALKTVSHRAADDDLRADAERTLRREAEVRAALDHPALLALHDVLRRRGQTTLVGPWLAGGTLFERWRERQPVDAVVALAEQVGAGLDALHARGWVHGDLSPNNIVFDGAGRPRISDFGSCVPVGARRTADGVAGIPTRWGVTRLTGAPESWTGEVVDGRADLYALGVILYFLLVGRWPFEADDTDALIRMHTTEPVPRPSELCTLLSPAVDDVMLRALAKRPGDRFDSGAALSEAVRAASRAAGVGPVFVPIAGAPRGDDAATRARQALEQFVAGLAPEEREVFKAGLAALQRREAADRSANGSMLRSMAAPLAALRAAEDLGLLALLATRPQTTQELARSLSLPEDSTERLCRFLAADGRLRRTAEGWSLLSPLSAAYTHGVRLGAAVHPVGDTQVRWGQLARWVRTGTPDIGMDADEDGLGYAGSVGDLGTNSEGQARDLARALRRDGHVPDTAAILDVGAGSAVWSLALAAQSPGAGVTALDRPKVLEVARARAQAWGLVDRFTAIAGSWQSFEPPPAAYGVIVLAKICHIESLAGLCALVRRLRPALRPEGRMVIIDTIPDDLARAPLEVLRYDLALALRTLRGRIHDRAAMATALAAADLRLCAAWRVSQGGPGLDVLVARLADDR